MNNKLKYSAITISEMFWGLFPAQFLSNATASLCNVINGIIVGNFLSASAIVALGFISPLTSLLAAISSIVSGGARIVSGKLIGRGEAKKIKEIYTNSLIALLIIGVLLTMICFLFSNSIASLLGAKADSIIETSIYIKGLSIGIIPTLIVPSLMIFLQMINDSTLSFVSVIVLTIFNLLFSLINVLVVDGGVFGMGLSTSLSQLMAMIFLFICVYKRKDILSFEGKSTSAKTILNILKIGSPAAIASILYPIRNIVFNSEALLIAGTDAVSALAIMNSTAGVFDAVNIAVGSVAIALASVFTGEKDSQSLKILFKTILKYGLILAFIKIVIIVLFSKQLTILFGGVNEVIDMCYELYIFYGICMPINIITLSLLGPIQSFEKVTFVNTLYLFNAIIVPIGTVFLLKNIIGIRAIFIAYALAELVTIIIIYLTPCIKAKHLLFTFEDIFEINKNIEVSDSINISVKDINEIVKISSEVENFCVAHGIDARRSKMSGLCLEEVAGNVVEHGFTKTKKNKLSIDIYVSVIDDKVILRIRDNAPNFDPRSKLGEVENDPCKNIGIRLVSKIAKQMNYQNYFGMNVLSIEL